MKFNFFFRAAIIQVSLFILTAMLGDHAGGAHVNRVFQVKKDISGKRTTPITAKNKAITGNDSIPNWKNRNKNKRRATPADTANDTNVIIKK